MDEPFFDAGTFKKLGQIPDYWFWAVVRKQCICVVSLKLIDEMTEKSNSKFRMCFLYFTGLDKSFELDGELYEQACLKHLIKELMKSRGDLLNRGDGFFNREINDENEAKMFDGPHGVFAFFANDKEGMGFMAPNMHSPHKNFVSQA